LVSRAGLEPATL